MSRSVADAAAQPRWLARPWPELVVCLAGTLIWPHFLSGAGCLLMLISAARLYRAWRFQSTVDEADRSVGRRVVLLGSVSTLLSFGVVAVGATRLDGVDKGLSPGVFTACSAALLIRAFLEIRAARLSRGVDLPPPLSSQVDADVEATLDAVSAPPASGLRFGPTGRGEAARLVALASSAAAVALVVSVVAEPFEMPHGPVVYGMRRLFGVDDRGGKVNSSPPGSDEEGARTDPHPTLSASGDAQPSPTLSPSPVTADQYCEFETDDVFKRDAPGGVAARLIEAYMAEGAREIGCPRVVRASEGIFVAKLTGGQSYPVWVVANRNSPAAVVFDDLVPIAKRLWRNGVFARAFPRQKTGAGDYQLFEKTDGSCILAIRNVYGQGYVVLPTPVTHAVMHLADIKDAFPYVEDVDGSPSLVGHGRFRVSWINRRGHTKAVTMTKRSAPDALRGIAAELVNSHRCPNIATFDALAAQARASSESEAARKARAHDAALAAP